MNGKTTDKGEHILTEDEKVEEEVLDSLEEEPVLEEEISDDEEAVESSEKK